MAGPGQRFYEDDEAEQILRLAASMSSSIGKMSHERLLETAAELGISPEAVEAAETQVATERREQKLRTAYEAHVRREFASHLTAYLFVCAFLVIINVVVSPQHWWSLWTVGFWGLGLAGHAWGALLKSSDSYRQGFDNWRERNGDIRAGINAQPETMHVRPQFVVGVHVRGGRRNRLRRYDVERSERNAGRAITKEPGQYP